MMVAMGNTFALSEADCVLPVVPMFHVNAWGYPSPPSSSGPS